MDTHSRRSAVCRPPAGAAPTAVRLTSPEFVPLVLASFVNWAEVMPPEKLALAGCSVGFRVHEETPVGERAIHSKVLPQKLIVSYSLYMLN